ncbi:hypothetical protein RRG08_021372 [Elysia crispata]|uniref:Uncharacterized protein n=1 Tax=Elysia crispata TaxID=231223 RepID=A0AAE0YDB3_9GAST|nr:hypothetical protein RRG08_021372 [Elysia crispata]
MSQSSCGRCWKSSTQSQSGICDDVAVAIQTLAKSSHAMPTDLPRSYHATREVGRSLSCSSRFLRRSFKHTSQPDDESFSESQAEFSDSPRSQDISRDTPTLTDTSTVSQTNAPYTTRCDRVVRKSNK